MQEIFIIKICFYDDTVGICVSGLQLITLFVSEWVE